LTYYYSIANIRIPNELQRKLEYLLEEKELTPYFNIRKEGYHSVLEFDSGNYSASTIVEIDDFLRELATLLKNTPFDFQEVAYAYDLGNGHFFFVNGKLADIGEKVLTRKVEEARLGERYKMTLEVEVLGVAPNKIVILG